jgi:hypothetical protein
MKLFSFLFLTLFSFLAFHVSAQLTPYYHWTLLPEEVFDEIAGESSGEIALHHVIEMAGYQRNRPVSEYSGNLRESAYILEKLKEYRLGDPKIEKFEGGKAWQGLKGELWEVKPHKAKLADMDDVALMLAQGSKTADVTAELVWAEEGLEKDFNGLDVKGKIVVTSSMAGSVSQVAFENGALGVVAFGSGRDLTAPLAIPASGIRGEQATFGFYLPPREGYILRDRLKSGEKITVHAIVEATEVQTDLQIPTCVIAGTDPSGEEVIFSAHIFEGFLKQGANDNLSGGAAILEVARTLNTLIKDGRIQRPKRSIRFIWVPEYSGTTPWVAAHRDLMARTLCNINLDMVGLHLKSNNSFFCLMRTTYGNPHYINDVMENYYTYVGETNREILPNRSNEKIIKRLVSPSGSEDPFYYQIDTHYGSSDHEVFNDWTTGVPGVMMITWPDMYYHTSEDLPDKLDPTQFKRAVAIAAASAYTIASAGVAEAKNIAGEVYSNSEKRMGHQLARALDEIKNAKSDNLPVFYKRVKGYIDAAAINEKATIQSVAELAPADKSLASFINSLIVAVQSNHKSNLAVLQAKMESIAADLGMKPVIPELTDLEKKAMAIIPKTTKKLTESAYGVERGTRNLPNEIRAKFPVREIADASEFTKLINGRNSVLDIKILLDAQNRRESGLQDIINYLELFKVLGLVEM